MGRGTRTREPTAAISVEALRDRLRARGPVDTAPAWTTSTRMPEPPLQWRAVDSSNVLQAAFRPPPGSVFSAAESGSVFVEFRGRDENRTVYRLDDVPRALFDELLAAASPGRFYNDALRGCFDGDKLVGDEIPD